MGPINKKIISNLNSCDQFNKFLEDLTNAAIVTQSGGIPLTIQCLSNPIRNTVSTKTCKVIDVFHSFDSTILILGHQTS